PTGRHPHEAGTPRHRIRLCEFLGRLRRSLFWLRDLLDQPLRRHARCSWRGSQSHTLHPVRTERPLTVSCLPCSHASCLVVRLLFPPPAQPPRGQRYQPALKMKGKIESLSSDTRPMKLVTFQAAPGVTRIGAVRPGGDIVDLNS